MKNNIRCACLAILAGAFSIGLAQAEDKSSQPGADMAEMMKKAEQAGKPGAAHRVLQPLVGDWTAEVKCWTTPGEPPMISKGTAKATWIMDGRFVKEEFNGEFMGKPFHGISLTGYDNMKQKYTTLWIDDMSTAMVTSTGEAKDGGKVLTFEGKYDCAVTGQKDMTMRQVVRIVNPNTRIFEMHDPSRGEHSKTMEITYKLSGRNVAEAGAR